MSTSDDKPKKLLPVIKGDFDFRPSFVFGKNGPIAKNNQDYQVRDSQVTLAEYIQRAMDEKKHLLAEAATGTGKSFASLLGAFKKSIETQTPVVISTQTISLQKQLADKDVPFLLERLGLSQRIKVETAMGRGNYVSLRRADVAMEAGIKNKDKLAEWLRHTPDGSKSSLTHVTDWKRIRSDTDQCMGESCSYFENCFYQNSRRRIAESHVIIANHSLVLLDRKMKALGMRGSLPEYSYLIVDEAHEFEHVARQVLTFELRQSDIPAALFDIYNDSGSGFLRPLLNDAQGFNFESETSKEADDRRSILKAAGQAVLDVLKSNEELFEEVATFGGDQMMKRIEKKQQFQTPLIEQIGVLNGALKAVSSCFNGRNEKASVDFCMKKLTEIAMGLDEILTLPNVEGRNFPNNVAWASCRKNKYKDKEGKERYTRSYTLVNAPIFMKGEMQRLVFKPLESVTLMSATLATAGKNPFSMIESALGVQDPIRLKLPSVFDYKRQAVTIVVDDMPEQRDPTYVREMAAQISKYSKVVAGGTLALFTSFKTMKEVAELVENDLRLNGCQLFCQSADSNRDQMIEQFKAAKKGVLFGVSTFWTGVDIPGKALTKLIVTKLPFKAPNDPLVQAQQEIFDQFGRNYFMERLVPQTAITLKQGFGRLIRKASDRGIVVILDSRVVTKKYGPIILNSLPKDCPVKRAKRDSKIK